MFRKLLKLLKKINNKFLHFRILDNFLLALIWPFKQKDVVLLIRLDAIGDFIIWLDSARHYRKKFPEKKIVLLVNHIVFEIAKEQPYWDEVIALNRSLFISSYKYRFIKLLSIRLLGIDIAIQPTYSREFYFGDSVIKASGARQKIGSIGDLSNITLKDKKISDSWYTELLPAKPGCVMELERNAEFFSHLAHNHIRPSIPCFNFTTTIEPLFAINSKYYILFASASWYGRRWPLKNYAELAGLIYQKTGLQGLLCGQGNEYAEYEKLTESSLAKLENWAGKTTLLELVHLIKNAQFVISNETSATHIATSVNTPSVCVLGGGHFGRFLPYTGMNGNSNITKTVSIPVFKIMDCYNCNWHCHFVDDSKEAVPCVKNITVNDIWVEVERMVTAIQK